MHASADPSDHDLLAAHRGGVVDAFNRLVARHIDWVYSAALRQVHGDAHLADDVTQTVFIILQRKAGSLKPNVPVGPWLFNVVRLASKQALRSERRRRGHEQKAVTMKPTQTTLDADGIDWERIAPLLDRLVAKLDAVERQCVLLRLYQRKTFSEIGAATNLSEEAARKRVDRGVQKLREQFAWRGVTTLSASALGAAMLAHATAPASAGTVIAVASVPTASAAALAHTTFAAMTGVKIEIIGATVLGAAVIIASIFLIGSPKRYPAAPSDASPTAAARVIVALPDAIATTRPANVSCPPGWPVALPGSITGTPVVADLEGNGKLCVVVPCETLQGAALVHPNPHRAAMLFAFRADGTQLPGWPIELLDAQRRDRRESNGYVESWTSSPTVARGRDGRPRIVITTPYFMGIRIVSADGKVIERPGGSQWASVPVVDINGDGIDDIITGAALFTIEGGRIPGWPASHDIGRISGFAPCIGDADGDGHLDVFHLMLPEDDQSRSRARIEAFSDKAQPVGGGFPRVVHTNQWVSYAPVMGDISGDAKMEIVGNFGDIYAFTCDGRPAPATHEEGDFAGILVKNASRGACSPTLADLDGDGKADIIVYDHETKTLRAWHGDGKPITADPNGMLADLNPFMPSETDDGDSGFRATGAGVSVADLGGDRIIDLFVGTNWIKFDPRTKASTVTAMLPGAEARMNNTQATICDLNGDGKADVVFGLADGRVFAIETKLAYKEQWMQWPTANGNFRHTGVWRAAATAPAGR